MFIESMCLARVIHKFWERLKKQDPYFIGLIILLVLAVASWLGVSAYLFYFKAPKLQNYSLDSLSKVGDAFNIATSFTGLVTVAFVAYAVKLQRRELATMSRQLEEQTKASKEEEKINRTMKIIDEYTTIIHDINKYSPYSREKYQRLVYFSNRLLKLKNTVLRDHINFLILEEINIISSIKKHLTIANDEVEERIKSISKKRFLLEEDERCEYITRYGDEELTQIISCLESEEIELKRQQQIIEHQIKNI